MAASARAAPAPIVIRPAERRHLEAIVALLAADVIGGHQDTDAPEALPDYERAFAEIEADPAVALYVACLGERVVGTFQLVVVPCLVGRGCRRALLEAVQVDRALRGRGVGSRLVGFAIAEARRLGAGSIELTSNKRRVDAHRFYERLGFSRSHEGFKLALA